MPKKEDKTVKYSALLLYAVCFILSFAITVLFGKLLIPRLRGLGAQPIYEGGPTWHIAKRGTPTMGGLCFVPAVLISLLPMLLFLIRQGQYDSAVSLTLCISYALLNSVIGMIDDLKKLRKKENKGLTALEKLVLQSIATILFIFLYSRFLTLETDIRFGFGYFELGFWYYPLLFLILVGITNCANLTDGIDGLASSVSFACALSLFYITYAGLPVGGFLSSALAGGVVGFLIFNLHPARVFMGDTGSLFLGSALASISVTLNNPFLIIPICAFFIFEGASVILQVFCYKLFRKRIFKMAPLHHHLEKSGWSENKICIVGILLTFAFSLFAMLLYSL